MKSSFFCFLLLLFSLHSKSADKFYQADDKAIEALFSSSLNFSDSIPGKGVTSIDNASCLHSYSLGQSDAHEKSLMVWGLVAAPVTCCTGGCSAIAMPFAAVKMKNEPASYPPGVDKECYRKGWQMESLKKRNTSIAIGSAIGFTTFLISYVAFYLYASSLPAAK